MISVATYKAALLVLLAVAGASSGTSAYFYQQRTAELNSQNANLAGQVTAYKDQTDNLAVQVSSLDSRISELQSQLSQLQSRTLRTMAVHVIIMDETTVNQDGWGVAVSKFGGTEFPVTFPFAFTPEGEFRSVVRVALSIYYLPSPTPACANCNGFQTILNGASTATVPMPTMYQLNLSTLEDSSYGVNLRTGANLLELRLSSPDANAVIYVAKVTATIEYQSMM